MMIENCRLKKRMNNDKVFRARGPATEVTELGISTGNEQVNVD